MVKRARHRLDDGASVAEHAARLRGRPGWDPAQHRVDAAAELEQQLGALHAAVVLGEAEACADCAATRVASGDPSALCPAHLARALGL